MRAHTDCIYDETSDRRRKIAEKRTADRLLHTRELFRNLLETLRFGQRDQVDHVLRAVRFDTSLRDIVTTILQTRQHITNVDPTRSLSLEDLDDLSTDIFATTGPSRVGPHHKALSLQELCCDSPFQVHSRGWTAVADDKVTSHLVSIYLTWYQPFMHILDEDAFLHDMSSETSNFCSSLLINAICAVVSSVCWWCSSSPFRQLTFAVDGGRQRQISRPSLLERMSCVSGKRKRKAITTDCPGIVPHVLARVWSGQRCYRTPLSVPRA